MIGKNFYFLLFTFSYSALPFMNEQKEKIKLMIVAGEASGDIHAAELVKTLKEISPNTEFEFFGLTGHAMRDAGVESVVKNDELGVQGLYEIFVKAFAKLVKAFRKLKEAAIERKPDAVILIDYPDFNLRLARSLKKRGLKVIYYISPQLWAWRSHRVGFIKKYVDLMLVVFPFELEWYKRRGVNHVEYVGHPLAGEVKPKYSKEEFCRRNNLDSSRSIISLLPGSRRKAMWNNLPILFETASLLSQQNPGLQFVVALAPTRKREEVEELSGKLSITTPASLVIVENETREAIAASDVAAVVSGTATLETALLETPLVVVYKEFESTYRLFKPLINVEFFSLVNIIAGEKVVEELIQHDFTPQKLADELKKLLEPKANQEMRESLREIVKKLGNDGSSKRAAETVLHEVRRKVE